MTAERLKGGSGADASAAHPQKRPWKTPQVIMPSAVSGVTLSFPGSRTEPTIHGGTVSTSAQS